MSGRSGSGPQADPQPLYSWPEVPTAELGQLPEVEAGAASLSPDPSAPRWPVGRKVPGRWGPLGLPETTRPLPRYAFILVSSTRRMLEAVRPCPQELREAPAARRQRWVLRGRLASWLLP